MSSKTFPCDKCEKGYNHRQNLTDHKRLIHENIKLKCDKCELKFSYRKDVKRHINSFHEENQKEYKCEFCNYSSKWKHHLRGHNDTIHLGLTFECKNCKYKGHTKRMLKEHTRIVHEGKLLQCSEFKNYFGRQSE